MEVFLDKESLRACLRYCAASAKRRKAIRVAYSVGVDRIKITNKVREEIFKAIMDAIDAGVACGIYALDARVYFK